MTALEQSHHNDNGRLVLHSTAQYCIYSENKPIILMGDFNIDLLSDENRTLKTSWTDLVTDMGLGQLIGEPTRITESSGTLIDHIYISSELPVSHSVAVKYRVSDHYPIYACFDLKNSNSVKTNYTHKTITYRKHKHLKMWLNF